MPTLPGIYGRQTYSNRANVGQASGHITQNLIEKEGLGDAVRQLGKNLADLGSTALDQMERNRITGDKEAVQRAELLADEEMNTYQQSMMRGEKLDVPIEMSMSPGGFVYQNVMQKLGVTPDNNSDRAKLQRVAVRRKQAQKYINFVNLRTNELKNSQHEKVYGIVEREKDGLNYENFDEKLGRIKSTINDLPVSAKEKKDLVVQKTYAFRVRTMENDLRNFSASVLNLNIPLEQKKDTLLDYQGEIRDRLRKTESLYSGITDTEKIAKMGEALIGSIIKRADEQEKLGSALITKAREDFLDDFDYSFARTYKNKADVVLSNTGIDDRWNDRIKKGKADIVQNGSLASTATGGVDPGGYNFETGMNDLATDLNIGFTKVDPMTGNVSLAPLAERKIKENGILMPYLDYINQNALQNTLVQRALIGATQEEIDKIKSRFHRVIVNGREELRYKSFMDAMLMNGGKSEFMRAFEGDDYTKEQKIRDDKLIGQHLASLDSGLYSDAQTRARLLWQLENTDLSAKGYERALKMLKKRVEKEDETEPKLADSVKGAIKSFGNSADLMITGALDKAYNSDPALTAKRRFYSQETGAFLPIDAEITQKRTKLKIAYNHRIAALKQRVLGMDEAEALAVIKKEQLKIAYELSRGHLSDNAGKRIEIRTIVGSAHKGVIKEISLPNVIKMYRDKGIKLTPEMKQELEQRIVQESYKYMDQLESKNVAETNRKR